MNASISVDELIRRLLPVLKQVNFGVPIGGIPASATRTMYLALQELGTALSFEVRLSDRTRSQREYLYDVVWVDRRVSSLKLVAEVEWSGSSAVKYDFEKLLYAKAPIKLLVCDVCRSAKQLLLDLSQTLRVYPDHLNGEQYVVILCQDAKEGRCIFIYSWIAMKDGSASDPQLELTSNSPVIYNSTGFANTRNLASIINSLGR